MQRNQTSTIILGGPERSRTSDLRFRKPLLYPAELRDHGIENTIQSCFRNFAKRVIPTLLLPFRFAMLVYGRSQGHVNATSRISLHPRHDMAVQIECGADIRMPKALLRDLWMYAACKQLCRVGVAQIVEPDARQRGACYEPRKFMCKALRH
jgi:hypothetical protein